MKISKAHQRFAEYLEKPDALENPQNYLGPNYLAVINFWLWIDTLSTEQWEEVGRRFNAIPDAAWKAACDAARNAAWDAARDAARKAAGNAARKAAVAARNVAGYAARNAAACATYELIGSHILLEKGTPLTFVPLFENL